MDLFNSKRLLKQINQNNIINQTIKDETVEFSKISNMLIHQTLVLRENLKYWNNLNNSVIRKSYYTVQIAPQIIYEYIKQAQLDSWEFKPFPNLFKVAHKDIHRNIDLINQNLNSTYTKLGILIREKDQLQSLDANDFKIERIESIEPSFWVKYWIPIGAAILLGPVFSVKIIKNRSAIIDWINSNIRDVFIGFYENWLIKPIKDMVNVIKQDSNIIAAKESLNSSIASLERMVKDFITDNKIQVDDTDLKRQIELGDLTLIMSKYENEMKSPIKNAFRGSLIRSLLIQIQKTKVDGDLVINGIDKLMKSQQLLLGIVSISPSIFIVYQLMKYLTKPSFIINGKDVKKSCLSSLVGLKLQQTDTSRGNLLVNVISLKIESKMFLPKDVWHMLNGDLDRLTNGENVLDKLYVIYSSYFK